MTNNMGSTQIITMQQNNQLFMRWEIHKTGIKTVQSQRSQSHKQQHVLEAGSQLALASPRVMLTCSLHCTRALWISFGFRAWAWGRQLSASSAAARTMLESLAREALSANDATSGGVRCPSQHSTKMFKAALPISMACPKSKREDSHTTVCPAQFQSAFAQQEMHSPLPSGVATEPSCSPQALSHI